MSYSDPAMESFADILDTPQVLPDSFRDKLHCALRRAVADATYRGIEHGKKVALSSTPECKSGPYSGGYVEGYAEGYAEGYRDGKQNR